jgi:hypothetical protein
MHGRRPAGRCAVEHYTFLVFAFVFVFGLCRRQAVPTTLVLERARQKF